MKIAQYNDMMSYLTRPGFKDGDTVVPPPKPLTESQVKNKLDLYIKGFIGGFDKMEMIDLMNEISKKADESGVMSQEDVFNFVQERKDFYQKFLEENKGEGVELPRQEFDRGGAAKFREFLKTYKPKEIYKGFKVDLAKKFNISPDTVGDIIKADYPELNKLPVRKTKEELRKEAVAKKKAEINFLDNTELAKQYKLFKPGVKGFDTGSIAEFTEFLNNKGFRTLGGQPFTLDSLGMRLKRANLPSKFDIKKFKEKQIREGIPLKPEGSGKKGFTEDFVRSEAERMNLDVEGKNLDEIKRMVFTSRSKEKGLTEAELKELRDFRTRKKIKKTETPRLFPYNLPKDAKARDLFWRDLLENASRHQSSQVNRGGPKLPVSHIQFKNPDQKRPTDTKGIFNIELVDTNVVDKKGNPKVITYDNFLKHIDDNKNLYGTDSETALTEYKKKRLIQKDSNLRDQFNKKLNKSYDPQSKTSRAVFSPFHIHHTGGRGLNAFNVQFAVGTENMQENALRRAFDKAFAKADTLTEKKNALKTYLDKVPPNLEVRLKNTPYGNRETLVEMTKRVAPSLTEQIKDMELRLPSEAGMISTDLLKDVGKFGLKTIGSLPVAVGLAADTTKRGMDEGKSFIDAVTQPMVGVDLLFPEAFKKLGPLMAKAARVSTPVGVGITGIGILKDRAKNMINQAEAIAATEATPYQQDLIEDFAKQYKGFEYGGRVGYADGPDDPSKRKFLKIMGGLASLPLVGRFFRVGEMAAPVAEKAVETVSAAPKYFFDLVNKIKLLGTESKIKPSERMTEINYTGMDGSQYTLTEDSVTGLQRIEKDKIGGYADENVSFDTIENKSVMEYQPSRRTEDGLEPEYYDEGTADFDPDGTVGGYDDGIEDDIIEQIKKEADDKR